MFSVFWSALKNKIHFFSGGAKGEVTANHCTFLYTATGSSKTSCNYLFIYPLKSLLHCVYFKYSLGQCLHLSSVWRQQPPRLLPPPLLFTFSYCSRLPRGGRSATCCRRSPLYSFTPLSNHVHSCILHLQHHIRPVLFLPTTLIYIPPPCPSPSPASSPVFWAVWVTLGT